MEYNKKNVLKNVKKSWKKFLKKKLDEEILEKIEKDRENNLKEKKILPEPKLVFNAFKHFELKELKVVLLGQDPYIRYEIHDGKIIPQAMGLAFSVPKEIKKIPPSLKNIFKELKNNIEGFNIPDNGDLTRWVKEEKILLLNSALTVIEGKSSSHQKIWEKLTDSIIKYISDNTENIIFILLGNFAKNKSKLIDLDKHYIIKGVHPSPLSASRGFFGSKIFSRTNEFLKDEELNEIDWKL
jgi:uracil-DNA glycosylase